LDWEEVVLFGLGRKKEGEPSSKIREGEPKE
jgi:hypothetical protein